MESSNQEVEVGITVEESSKDSREGKLNDLEAIDSQ